MLTCADQYCPSNLVTTIFQIRDALYADFFTLIRLIAKCFGDHGIAGCICQLSVRSLQCLRDLSRLDICVLVCS